ncbi:ParA family protein [Amycolatopsis sp.]|uniref:ParA family protein n=1 Tax=Amycolatopsis sp. TaxID=37632 RepID=UPI002C1C0BED|nr:ParA family protein [Amycolatopsis sp.]HVV12777.1 ParA family protein [Amycolatopsis sp.]
MAVAMLDHERLTATVRALREQAATQLQGKIITVLSPKGGQGKSTLAKELAWILNGVLVDLDWDGGRVSRLLGYLADRYRTAPLLDALFDERGRPPRVYRSRNRPDMVPGHRDFEPNQPEPDAMADLLIAWNRALGRSMVVDTHPGGSRSTLGAAQAADLVVMPVILGTGELDAVEDALTELAGFNLLLVPNHTPANPQHLPRHESSRLLALAEQHDVRVADTFVRHHGWMTRRKVRTVISAQARHGKNSAALTHNMTALAREVLTHAA